MVILVEGYPYVAVELEDGRGWDIWKLKLDSPVYHVGPHGCTCKADKPCKHMRALLPAAPKRLEPHDPRRSRG